MDLNTIIEYKVGISPSRITYTPEWYYKRTYSTQGEINRLANLKHNATKDVLTRKTGMKIQRCVEWMNLTAYTRSTYCKTTKKSYTHKLSMITLTIPECTNIPTIQETNKNLLNNFLKSAKKYYGLITYVWIAEYQENGMPHYHITTTDFIHYTTVQKIWNKLLNKYKYTIDFEKRHHHKNPPSTQTKSIQDESKTARYLAKYMSKSSQQKESGNSRRWGASQNLTKALKATVAISPQEFEYIDNNLQNLVSFANISGARGTYFMKTAFKPLQIPGTLGKAYRTWTQAIRKNDVN